MSNGYSYCDVNGDVNLMLGTDWPLIKNENISKEIIYGSIKQVFQYVRTKVRNFFVYTYNTVSNNSEYVANEKPEDIPEIPTTLNAIKVDIKSTANVMSNDVFTLQRKEKEDFMKSEIKREIENQYNLLSYNNIDYEENQRLLLRRISDFEDEVKRDLRQTQDLITDVTYDLKQNIEWVVQRMEISEDETKENCLREINETHESLMNEIYSIRSDEIMSHVKKEMEENHECLLQRVIVFEDEIKHQLQETYALVNGATSVAEDTVSWINKRIEDSKGEMKSDIKKMYERIVVEKNLSQQQINYNNDVLLQDNIALKSEIELMEHRLTFIDDKLLQQSKELENLKEKLALAKSTKCLQSTLAAKDLENIECNLNKFKETINERITNIEQSKSLQSVLAAKDLENMEKSFSEYKVQNDKAIKVIFEYIQRKSANN